MSTLVATKDRGGGSACRRSFVRPVAHALTLPRGEAIAIVRRGMFDSSAVSGAHAEVTIGFIWVRPGRNRRPHARPRTREAVIQSSRKNVACKRLLLLSRLVARAIQVHPRSV